jgi:molecular chaperone IbpA
MNAKITDAMLRHGVGLNPWFFERNDDNAKFPPHNITQIGDDRYRLTLAVAGYTQDDLGITLQGELLTITGTKHGIPAEIGVAIESDTGHAWKMLYRGIAFRNFSREFMIGEHVDIEAANLKHGLLEIDLLRHIPESHKVKTIAISA